VSASLTTNNKDTVWTHKRNLLLFVRRWVVKISSATRTRRRTRRMCPIYFDLVLRASILRSGHLMRYFVTDSNFHFNELVQNINQWTDRLVYFNNLFRLDLLDLEHLSDVNTVDNHSLIEIIETYWYIIKHIDIRFWGLLTHRNFFKPSEKLVILNTTNSRLRESNVSMQQ